MRSQQASAGAGRRLTIVVGALCLALGLVEVTLRLAAPQLFNDPFEVRDPVLGWSLRPNFSGWETEENTLWVTTNSAGFRDRERSVERIPGRLRVALIGDSYVHAFYLPLDKMPGANLERDLASCVSAPAGVEVLNFGVQGFSPAQELLMYRERVAAYHPDVVLLSFFTMNDITGNHPKLSAEPAPYFLLDGDTLRLDNSFRSTLPAPSNWPLRRESWEWLQLHSRTAMLLNQRLARLQPDLFGIPDRKPVMPFSEIDRAIYAPPKTPVVDEAWTITEAILKEFASEVSAAGAEFWIVTLSNNEQVDPDLSARERFRKELGVDDLFYPDRRVADFAKAHNIRVITLAPQMADYTARTHEYLNGGVNVPLGSGHWNENGSRVAAEFEARQLCRESSALHAVPSARSQP